MSRFIIGISSYMTSMESSKFWIVLFIWISNLCCGMSNQRSKPGEILEYCQLESMKASCGIDEVIVMNSAWYGRMNLGRCVSADLGFVGCSSDVLDIADKLCSGRRECEIAIPNKEMKQRQDSSKQRCLKELKLYLKASYKCQKVTSVNKSQCRSCDYVKVRESSGVIASYVTKASGCGSPDCPWLISVPTGQRVNITLINFRWTMPKGNTRTITYNIDPNRQVLATVKESAKSRPVTIYGTHFRERHAYTSLGNTVELRVVPGRMEGPNAMFYLFKYEAIGCIDPDIPNGGWIQRDGDQATVGCNHTTDSVKWKCTDNKWEGPSISCQEEAVSAVVGYVKVGSLTLSFGLSITVIVVLAAVICLAIVCIGLVIFRRRRAQRHLEEPIYQPPPYMAANYRDPPPSYDKGTTKRDYHSQNGPREENGYTHIWQRPLPDKPEDMMMCPVQDSTYVQEPGSVHYGYNSIASVPKSNSKGKSRGHGDTHIGLASLRENRTGPADTRYFQLEDRVTSNHVSA